VLFAGKIIPHITEGGLTGVLDLEDKIATARRHILEWNGSG